MKTEPRQYKDVAGNLVTLDWITRNEPEWAANQIRHRDTIEAELKELATIINEARDRALDEEACRPCRWLIELPMTDAEASCFRDILSKNRVAEPSNAVLYNQPAKPKCQTSGK